jgi:hypothetical protein
MISLLGDASYPLVDTGGGTRDKPVGGLDTPIVDVPREECVTDQRVQVHGVEQWCLPADIHGEFLAVRICLSTEDGEPDRIGNDLPRSEHCILDVMN